MRSSCRSFLAANFALAALLLSGAIPAKAADGTVRFGAYGGNLLEEQKSYLGAPFEELTGATIQWTAGTEQVYATKLAAAGSSPPFDVVMLDEPWYSMARVRGSLEKLTPDTIPNLKAVKKEFTLPDNIGVCLFSLTLGIVYNKDKFKELGIAAPVKWQDLADPKLGGHVGIQTLAATAPKHLLAAYAIQLGDPPTKWDRAIDEVAKIKFHSFSSGVADLVAKIEAGDVWAAPITNGRAASMIVKGLPLAFVMPENGDGSKGGLACTAIAVAKNSPNRVLSEKLINFALSPDAQLMQATSTTPYGPVISSLDSRFKKTPDLAAAVPWGDQTQTALRLSWKNEEDLAKFAEYVEAWNRKIQK